MAAACTDVGSDAVLLDTAFISNTAAANGGAMYNSASSPGLFFATFRGNAAGADGGAMFNENGSNAVLVNALFDANRADADGDSAGMGGGIFNANSSPDLTNVTITGNSAHYGGGIASTGATGSAPHLCNTIVWGNTAPGGDAQIHNEGPSQVLPSACMVQGPDHYGCTVVDTASPFVDAAGPDGLPGTADDDLRLAGTSNAIDAGSADSLPQDLPDRDQDGDTTEGCRWISAGPTGATPTRT